MVTKTKQDIREGLEARLEIAYSAGLSREPCNTNEMARQAVVQLHSQGVVLKVEGELPKNPYSLDYKEIPPEFQSDETATDEDVFLMHCNGIEKGKSLMLKAGYTATEPLLEASQ